ncbi:NAD(P)H-quinone dehydrogenase [Georgenia sp. 10Sc9-8]|uniref:NAD(P)H-quinone dehydrogenase n=1 Tax=Georgenia halotolerans TaxID=3028317 RepID=A0ABT5TY94_9MICO|nr:NAD(P)H-quinone dehydrogenase [Georgenia halotolerans]
MSTQTPPPPSTGEPAGAPQPAAARRGTGEGHAGASPVREGSRVVIVGGGPGGYEAALVARRLGARVQLVESHGMGGAAVLTDVVPSKTLIATAEWMTVTESATELGIRVPGTDGRPLEVDLGAVNQRVRELARRQSEDIHARLEREGVEILLGTGRLGSAAGAGGTRQVLVTGADGEERALVADVVLLATGASPRKLAQARPDGERILTWTQLYRLSELPEHLVVVGSGVTGAEFAGAYTSLGAQVTLVSSRDRVLPGEDAEAAELIETVFRRRGMQVLSRTRAQAVRRTGSGVAVELNDGSVVEGSHCLMAVGGVPNTTDLGLEEAGVRVSGTGNVQVDRVSRTTTHRVYAAGDCTGVLPLASVAAMQGRVAMWHALGDAVAPLDLDAVAANIFTAPEIATIGVTEAEVSSGAVDGVVSRLPLARNPRAKMLGIREGFVKIFSDRASGTVLGGVVVAPRAGELIYPVTIAVTQRLTVDELANVFTVYPSLGGSVSEAARTLHRS